MTNFLNRLAGRSLGRVPVAEPIIPTRFSPVAERKERYNASFDRARSGTPDITLSSAEISSPTEKPQPTHRIPTKFSDAERQHIEQNKEPSTLRYLGTTVTPSSSHQMKEASSSHLSHKDRDQHHLLPTYPNIEPTPYPVASSPSKVTQIGTSDELSSYENLLLDRPRSAVPQLNKSSLNPPVDQSATSTAPMIRVTIGRIDVRAELPSPPTATPVRRNRPSTVSLDQHLSRRSGY